jgi:hypothetical protein
MAYTDVITLSDAKVYLRVDDTLTEDDAQITRMINASLAYVEKWTNIMVFARLKTYVMVDGCVRVYDYPINSLIDPVDAEVVQKTLYTTYTYGTDTIDLSLNVGYVDPVDVPSDLLEVALEIIDLMYYEHESGKTVTKDLSSLSISVLDANKRFYL